MKSFFRLLQVAFSFLTILPVKAPANWKDSDLRHAVAAYGIVGLTIGMISAAVLLISASGFLQATLVVSVVLLLTGALHFDGFCDIADAVFPPMPRERRLEVLKDPRVGSFALAGGLLLLVLKIAAFDQIISVGHVAWLPVVLAPVLSRSIVTLPMAAFPVHDSSLLGRTSSLVWSETRLPVGFLLLVFLGSLLWASPAMVLILLAICLAWVYWFSGFINSRLGGLGGDAYGAIIETTEVLFLLLWSVAF